VRRDIRRGGRYAAPALAAATALAMGVPLAASAAPAPAPTRAAAAVQAAAVDLTYDFEDGTQGWGARGPATTAVTTEAAHGGASSLLTTGRTEGWHGATVDVTGDLAAGEAVEVSAWVRLPAGSAPASVNLSVQRDLAGSASYEGVAGAAGTVTADAWTELRGTYTLPVASDRVQLYAEGTAGASFLLDDVTVRTTSVPGIQDLPGLADVLAEDGIERVGVAVDRRETTGLASELLKRHYSAITPENDGKPAEIQPVEGQFTFDDLDALLDFADANDVEVYGHVLVWHSQTPDWFFLDGDRPLTSAPADQALLRSRMEAHIRAIGEHVAARYPDGDSPIWGMDVVNEVIADGDNANPHDMRDSRWFQVLGETFVDDAFRYADRYFPGTALFINDYNTEMPAKRARYVSLVGALQERGVPIDGVGHQAHVDFARPVQWLADSVDAVKALDPDLQQVVTELDVNSSRENRGADVGGGGEYVQVTEDREAAAAEIGYYYRDLFDVLRERSDVISSVTMWGINNGRSWLRTWPSARPWEQPLPFDDANQALPAYWGIVDPSQLPERPEDFLPPRFSDLPTVAARATTPGPGGVAVDYVVPEVRDTQDGVVTPTCSPRAGSTFAVGSTLVRCAATDSRGNVERGTFTVEVAPATQLEVTVRGASPATPRVGRAVTATAVLSVDGPGALRSRTLDVACASVEGSPGRLDLAVQQAALDRLAVRDLTAARDVVVTMRGTATTAGAAATDCTVSVEDEAGLVVSDTVRVEVAVRP